MLEEPSALSTRTNIYRVLPPARTRLIGRQRELAEVLAALSSAPLVSLLGPGGCGKTRLAEVLVRAVQDRFAGGIIWLELASVTDPGFVPQTLARALGVAEQPGVPLLEMLPDRLQGRDTLFVLDNCEHLLSACADLAEALLGCPGVKLLVTSREALGVAGERRYSVPPLALPPAKEPFATIAGAEAVSLFVERAQSIRADFTLTPENAETVAALCRRLDGLPLAIELASARVDALSVQDLSARLEGHLDILVSASRSASRHRTLRAAIGWSYDLLPHLEQLLFERLSVFAAGFTLETTEAVCTWGDLESCDLLNLLTSLVRKSLVVAEPLAETVTHYRLLQTVRQFAREALEHSGSWQETHEFYLSYYLEFAETRAEKLYEAEQNRYIQELDNEHDNLRRALAWAYEQRRTAEGLRLALALCQFWDARDYIHEGFTWFERFLHLPPEEAAELPLALHVNALTFTSFYASFLHNVHLTKTWAERAVTLCENSGEEGQALLPFALAGLDSAYRVAGDWETALGVLERTISLERAHGNSASRLLGMSLFVSGMTEAALGHFEEAHCQLDEALELAEAAADIYRTGFVCNALGDLARFEKRFAQALPYYEKSIELLQKIDANRMLPNTERNFAYACLRASDTARAYALFKSSLETHHEHSNRSGVLRGLLGFAALAASLRLDEASTCLHGFVFNQTTSLVSLESGDKADELDYEYFAAQAHGHLTDDELTVAQNRGRHLTLAQAVTYALSLPLASYSEQERSHDLTKREFEVLMLVGKGLANGEIADHLRLSKRTVEKHIANILAKLTLSNRAQMVRWAINQISPD